jgi:hypothetical protein
MTRKQWRIEGRPYSLIIPETIGHKHRPSASAASTVGTNPRIPALAPWLGSLTVEQGIGATRNPRRMDMEEKTLTTRQGRCRVCRGSGHRSADSDACFLNREFERKLNLIDLSDGSSDEEAPGKV